MKKSRINEKIKISGDKVRLVDADGKQRGVLLLTSALDIAREAGLDLVEVMPSAEPPVCKIMDYSRFAYKKKVTQPRQSRSELKEIRIRIVTDENDYQVKLRRAVKFLQQGHKVKFSVRFRGREIMRSGEGVELFKRIEDDLMGHGQIEKEAKLESKNLTVVFYPRKR